MFVIDVIDWIKFVVVGWSDTVGVVKGLVVLSGDMVVVVVGVEGVQFFDVCVFSELIGVGVSCIFSIVNEVYYDRGYFVVADWNVI